MVERAKHQGPTQVQSEGGFPGAVESAASSIEKHLQALKAIDSRLFSYAPQKAAEDAAAELVAIRQQVLYMERILVDQLMLHPDQAQLTKIATALHRGRGTVYEWAKNPLLESPEGFFGPGTIDDKGRAIF